MRNFILIALFLLTFADANAQVTGSNELHCTEEALTFKANIMSGWHFSAPVIANVRYTNTNRAGSIDAVNKSEYLLPSTLWPLLFKNSQHPERTFQDKPGADFIKYAFPVQGFKFSYNFYPINYHPVLEPAKSLLSLPAF